MKVILLGSTGFIGKEVLDWCLKNPDITSLIALSRRDLPGEAANPKLTVVIIEDFKLYPDSVLEQLKGADACVW
jgi:nucleoside-diphosphate-sugar epimerase